MPWCKEVSGSDIFKEGFSSVEISVKNHPVVGFSFDFLWETALSLSHCVRFYFRHPDSNYVYFFSLINLFEKQQLRKHCVTALKVFTCCMNSLCTDYTHSTGARRFLLRSPKAFREKPLELYFFFYLKSGKKFENINNLKRFLPPFFSFIYTSLFSLVT